MPLIAARISLAVLRSFIAAGRARLGSDIPRRSFGQFAMQDIVAMPRCGVSRTAAMPRLAVDLVVGGAVGALLLFDQRLPIGDRNLIVVRMDFGKRQKAVAIAAVIDEGGLQRRLDARHFRQIDVAS